MTNISAGHCFIGLGAATDLHHTYLAQQPVMPPVRILVKANVLSCPVDPARQERRQAKFFHAIEQGEGPTSLFTASRHR